MSNKLATGNSQPETLDRSAGARILARSFYKELRSSGYTPRELLALSTELIELITLDQQLACVAAPLARSSVENSSPASSAN